MKLTYRFTLSGSFVLPMPGQHSSSSVRPNMLVHEAGRRSERRETVQGCQELKENGIRIEEKQGSTWN